MHINVEEMHMVYSGLLSSDLASLESAKKRLNDAKTQKLRPYVEYYQGRVDALSAVVNDLKGFEMNLNVFVYERLGEIDSIIAAFKTHSDAKRLLYKLQEDFPVTAEKRFYIACNCGDDYCQSNHDTPIVWIE